MASLRDRLRQATSFRHQSPSVTASKREYGHHGRGTSVASSLLPIGLAMFAVFFLDPVQALLVAAIVFIPFERLAAMHPAQRILRRGWATDVLTGFINGLGLYAAVLIVLAGVDACAAVGAPQLRLWVETRPLWVQAVLAVAVGDLAVYGIHRLTHSVPWLWRFHAVHHSAEEMDWLVGLRFHAVDLLLFRLASLGPLVALHVTPAAIGIFVAIFGWQSWLAHANVRLPYGPLRWVFVSPEFHHWHHSAEREAYDANYANVLACWDVLFGTVHLPRGRHPVRYGVEERIPAGYVNRFLHPFRRETPAESRRVKNQSVGDAPLACTQSGIGHSSSAGIA